MHLPPAAPAFVPCKICGEPAPFFGMTDFNRGCLESVHASMGSYGFAIYYRRCPACEFLFTDAFDDWSHEEFRTHIYNADYERLDPDYVRNRPGNCAAFVARLFGTHKDTMRLLDFGGGNGFFAECLRSVGFTRCDTYDPFTPGFDTPPEGTYNLITCIETMEHAPNPGACVQAITDRLAEDGVVLFSTLLQPDDFDKIRMTWWYIGPRNGHVSLHSKKSLALLWERHGCVVESVNEDLHMASRREAKDRVRLGGAAAASG